MVLGQMGWTTSPYPRAGALSCPSSAIARRRKGGGLPTVDGPGSQRSRPALVSTAKVSGLRRAFCLLALLVPAHLSSSAGRLLGPLLGGYLRGVARGVRSS